MIDVACDVAARAAVDRPLGVHPEKILATAFFDFLVRYAGTRVLDDSFTFGNRFQSKQSKTGGSSPNLVFSVSVIFSQRSMFPPCGVDKLEAYRALTRSAIMRLPAATNISPKASSVTNRSSSSFKRTFLCVCPL